MRGLEIIAESSGYDKEFKSPKMVNFLAGNLLDDFDYPDNIENSVCYGIVAILFCSFIVLIAALLISMLWLPVLVVGLVVGLLYFLRYLNRRRK